MGVERAVTRWYILRQPLVEEIAQLHASLALMGQDEEHTTASSASPAGELTQLQQRLAGVQEKLRALGPCPKPMMG